jgi:hypothetical protein
MDTVNKVRISHRAAWDYRYASPKKTTARNSEMHQQHQEGRSVEELAKKYGLSKVWTKKLLEREKELQEIIKNIPEKKITMADLGPFRPRTGQCLANENLLHLTIAEFLRTQTAWHLLGVPNFGKKSLKEIVVTLQTEGYDTSKFEVISNPMKIHITTSDDGELVATKGQGSSIAFAVLRKDENDVLYVSSTNVSGPELMQLILYAKRVNQRERLV